MQKLQAGTRTSPLDAYGTWALVAFAAAALVVGVWARFKGLGTWSFAVDEYYFAQSVQNLLRFGVPAYECGGYYTRGLLLQYLSAGLQLCGLSAELAPRALAAASSLIALPAVFLLGRRVHGTAAGLMVVSLLAVSVWEVEMARFGRMYAPFQAVFVWYLVCFVRYTVDGQKPALWGMVALSTLGVLVWEGGALLGAVNLLPPFLNHARGRLSAAHWRYLAGMAALFVPLYWFATNELRIAGEIPALPAEYEAIVAAARGTLEAPNPRVLGLTLGEHPLWLALALVPLAIAGWATSWISSLRKRWLAAAGLCVALLAALMHQFLVLIAALVLLVLLGLLHWRELWNREALPFIAATVAAGVFWIAFGFFTDTWRAGFPSSFAAVAAALGYQLLGFPDFLDLVARPFARAVPILSLAILLLVSAAGIRAILAREQRPPSAERALLVVAFALVLMTSASGAPRIETRYLFFLYPLLLLLAATALVRLTQAVAVHPNAGKTLGVLLVLAGFMLTEDFRPGHLRTIHTAEVNFRQDMSAGERSHYHPRWDSRGIAEWLALNTDPEENLVISGPGVAGIDFYYPHFDFVYLDPGDQRLASWSCQRGTLERWTNLPLVYSLAELKERIRAQPRAYMVVDTRRLEAVLMDLEELEPAIIWENEWGPQTVITFESISTS